jgi:protein involved in ribonucleotide reduction
MYIILSVSYMSGREDTNERETEPLASLAQDGEKQSKRRIVVSKGNSPVLNESQRSGNLSSRRRVLERKISPLVE